jgi:hypothetical protein
MYAYRLHPLRMLVSIITLPNFNNNLPGLNTMAAPLSDGPEIGPENGDNHRSEGGGTLRGHPEQEQDGHRTAAQQGSSSYFPIATRERCSIKSPLTVRTPL